MQLGKCIQKIELNHGRILKVFDNGYVRLYFKTGTSVNGNGAEWFPAPEVKAFRDYTFVDGWTRVKKFVKKGETCQGFRGDSLFHKKFENAEAAMKYANEYTVRFNARHPLDMFGVPVSKVPAFLFN